MTKHTPGPWRTNGTNVFQDNALDSVVMIASCGGALTHEECKANASLISDAPETAIERDRLSASRDKLSVSNAQLRELNAHLLGVLKKLKRILESPEFKAVEDTAEIHGVEYQGKEYTQPDLDRAIREADRRNP